MNNSKLAIDFVSFEQEEVLDTTPLLRSREETLVRIITAIRAISQSPEWSTLKSEIFDGLTSTLEKDLKNEARKDSPDTLKLSRLSGQLKWAERYADLSKLESVFTTELLGIKKKLNG